MVPFNEVEGGDTIKHLGNYDNDDYLLEINCITVQISAMLNRFLALRQGEGKDGRKENCV